MQENKGFKSAKPAKPTNSKESKSSIVSTRNTKKPRSKTKKKYQKRTTNEILYQLDGLQTVESIMEELKIKRQTANNLISKLNKLGHVQTQGKGNKIRFYKISTKKFRKRDPGMWDILNKYNPNFQLNEWYDHQVHGKYTVEDVIVDAIQKKSFRILLATLRLFQHVKDWPRLYNKAKKYDVWRQIGALYDIARIYIKVRKMPKRYKKPIKQRKNTSLFENFKTTEQIFLSISQFWKIEIPFKIGDIRKVIPGA